MGAPDLELSELNHFSGSEEAHRINQFCPTQLGTEGIAYLEQNGYGWFVSDMAIAIAGIPALKTQPFLSIKLKVNPDGTATATITDGNRQNPLYTQEYAYTDAKKDLHLFFTDNILMLAGEY
jgi:hypothetical protein